MDGEKERKLAYEVGNWLVMLVASEKYQIHRRDQKEFKRNLLDSQPSIISKASNVGSHFPETGVHFTCLIHDNFHEQNMRFIWGFGRKSVGV